MRQCKNKMATAKIACFTHRTNLIDQVKILSYKVNSSTQSLNQGRAAKYASLRLCTAKLELIMNKPHV